MGDSLVSEIVHSAFPVSQNCSVRDIFTWHIYHSHLIGLWVCILFKDKKLQCTHSEKKLALAIGFSINIKMLNSFHEIDA